LPAWDGAKLWKRAERRAKPASSSDLLAKIQEIRYLTAGKGGTGSKGAQAQCNYLHNNDLQEEPALN